jgi:hypothetical protein
VTVGHLVRAAKREEDARLQHSRDQLR